MNNGPDAALKITRVFFAIAVIAIGLTLPIKVVSAQGLPARAIARAYRRVVAMGSLDTGFCKPQPGATRGRHVHDRSTRPHMVPGRGFERGISGAHLFRA
jgi:hypothetical protein